MTQAGKVTLQRALGALAVASLVGVAGCVRSNDPAVSRSPSLIRIGYGLTTGSNAQLGMRQAAMIVSNENLIPFGVDGRPLPRLAESWERSADGRVWRITLRSDATFHDGTRVSAASVADVLGPLLSAHLGRAYEDVDGIAPVSDNVIEITLKRPSNFVLEGLDVPLHRGSRENPIGTGPFYVEASSEAGVSMKAHAGYYRGTPSIDEVRLIPYASVRSAWADMLRGEVDMLYEVGVDALDLLEPSGAVNVFVTPRPYASIILLNHERPQFRSAQFRRQLNAAIDREAILSQALSGQGRPAEGSVWPLHWAYDTSTPRLSYDPQTVGGLPGDHRFTILFSEPSHERMLLLVQRQLQEVGVGVTLERVPLDQALARLNSGNFDAFLADAGLGPSLVRPYLFWHSGSPLNWGRFSSPAVDAALDGIRSAPDDEAYRSAVSAFEDAIVSDPPAVFLTWNDRARAVSTRFEIPVEANRDILTSTLWQWKPVAGSRAEPDN